MTEITSTAIADVKIFTPRVFGDARGTFMETFRLNAFQDTVGPDADGNPIIFVQDNFSVSAQADTIRGLHYQDPPFAQGKLVRCVNGSVFDVAVDIRKNSPTYGQSVGVTLSAENRQQLWVPAGFLHGFLTLEDNAQVAYKCTGYYSPAHDGNVAWNDPELNIDWGLKGRTPILSDKDAVAPNLTAINNPF